MIKKGRHNSGKSRILYRLNMVSRLYFFHPYVIIVLKAKNLHNLFVPSLYMIYTIISFGEKANDDFHRSI